jgi:F-type H+-transporting ATPase subunit epsilon
VPGGEGDFGVLPGHAPLIASVRPGVIEIYDGREVSDRIFVAGGFAEVTRERCTVLAESAVRVSEINVGDAEADLRSAESDLANAASDNDRADAERRLGVAQGKLEAVRRSSH